MCSLASFHQFPDNLTTENRTKVVRRRTRLFYNTVKTNRIERSSDYGGEWCSKPPRRPPTGLHTDKKQEEYYTDCEKNRPRDPEGSQWQQRAAAKLKGATRLILSCRRISSEEVPINTVSSLSFKRVCVQVEFER